MGHIMKRTIIVSFFLLVLGFFITNSLAIDPPHDISNLPNVCLDCHMLHAALGNTLTNMAGNANLCMSCHVTKGIVWNSSDQAVPGTSGTSHRWDAIVDNPTYGAATPASPDLALRLDAGKLTCSACHDQHSQNRAPFDPKAPVIPGADGRHLMRINNNQNQMCLDCHTARNIQSVKNGSWTSSALSHPVAKALPATSDYHNPPLDIGGVSQAMADFGAATGGSATSLIDTSKDFTGTAGLVVRFTNGVNIGLTRSITSLTGTTQVNFPALPSAVTAGTTYEIDADGNLTNNIVLDNGGTQSYTTGNVLCQSCHGIHYADSDSLTYDDTMRTGDGMLLRRFNNDDACTGCHNLIIHNSANTSAKYGTWGTMFTCSTCHRPHNTSNIYLIRQTIQTPNSGTKAVDFRNTSGKADFSFATATTPGNGVCEVCHTLTQNSDATPRYRNTGESDGGKHFSGICISCHSHSKGFKASCVTCHNSVRGSRRQVVDSNGDGTGTGGDFKRTSHHIQKAAISDSECLICHDASQHASGNVRLKNADTGTVYTYDPANPTTAENFCLSCHDTDGANGNMSPFSDGKSLGVIPYQMSKEIKDNWNKTYGHKQQGLTCLGNGNQNTGCHSNGHGSDNKGLLSKNLTLPNTKNNWFNPAADEGDYEICFSCHQNYPRVTKEAVLGYRLGGNFDINGDGPPPYDIPAILTKFRDQNYNNATGKLYDDFYFFTFMSNLHYWHLQGGSWSYRGAENSSINCISCHSVHGSDTQWGWLYDQMQYNRYAGSGSDEYGTLPLAVFNSLENYPTNCTVNCHSIQGKTYNWFEPSGE